MYTSTRSNNMNLTALTAAEGFGMLSGSTTAEETGWSVSGAGDVNGDGYADVIIGAWYANNQTGLSYVVYGSRDNPGTIDLSTGLTSAQGFEIRGGARGVESGWSVSTAGDVNGDGFADIIIGAPFAAPNIRYGAGQAYVVYGSNFNPGTIDLSGGLTGQQGFIIIGGESGDHCGHSVSTAGDVNGDGYADIVIGAQSADAGSRRLAGQTYVLYGSKVNPGTIDLSLGLTGKQGFAILGGASGDRSGFTVSNAGDVNGDGCADIIIGIPYADPEGRSTAGQLYVVYGSSGNPGTLDLSTTLTSEQGFLIMGAAAYDQTGISVSGAGDVNGDGYADIVIGVYGLTTGPELFAGLGYVIYGSSINPGTLDLSLPLSEQGFVIMGGLANEVSYSVSGAGDVNNDGFADIIIGTPHFDPRLGLVGESYLVFGCESNPGTIDLLLNSTQISGGEAQRAGYSVSGAGDVNKDGYADVIIGAPGFMTPMKYGSGAAFVVYGSALSGAQPPSRTTHFTAGMSPKSIVFLTGGGLFILLVVGYVLYLKLISRWTCPQGMQVSETAEVIVPRGLAKRSESGLKVPSRAPRYSHVQAYVSEDDGLQLEGTHQL
jgi:hypothetical protein